MAETTSRSRATPAPSKPASAAARKGAATRKAAAVKRSTSAKRAAETRAANRGAAARTATARTTQATAARGRTSAAKRAAEAKQEIKSPIDRAVEMAERAVLTPVGAALIARDELSSTIEELRSKYSTRTKTRQELRRFERRGTKAVKGIERDARRTRTRVERELRQRRTDLERDLKAMIRDLETRTDPVVKNVELVGARVESAVQSGRTAATQASTRVQERMAALA